VRPDYPVAELGCGEGGTTYVLLDDGKLIAIHRDADVAGIEELSRS
jgi:16S rRNA A1518/A1519 N6-dimethyltransferase RsmA/KsgA/DIM1 with predicted DNA glycosylase/AP lyase activity